MGPKEPSLSSSGRWGGIKRLKSERERRKEGPHPSIVYLLEVLWSDRFENASCSVGIISPGNREIGAEKGNWLGLWYRTQTRRAGGVPDDFYSLVQS